MEDDHDSVVEFDKAYSKEVVFILGSMESLLENQDLKRLSSPSPGSKSDRKDYVHGPATSADHGQVQLAQGERRADPKISPPPESSSPPRKLRKQNRVEIPHEEEEGAASQITYEMEGKDIEATMAVKQQTPSSSEEPASKETIMKNFEETEKLFQEQVLGKMPTKQRQPQLMKSKTQPAALIARQVSKQPTSMPGAGMEHLDLLVKLMEQLSHIKEENSQLRHKCNFLNDTQSLLRIQNRLLLTSSVAGKETHRWRLKSHHMQQSHKGSVRKKVVENSQDSDSSDADGLPESRKKPKLHHRSQSVGSIHIERVDMELGAMSSKESKSPEKSKDGSRFEMFSKSKITSKWERVKKVFSGKPEQGSKVEHSTITAEQLVRANSKPGISLGISGQQLQPLPPIPTSKSVDSGMRPKSPEYLDPKLLKSSLSTGDSGLPPPSPSSIQSEPVIPSLVTNDDIYEDVNLIDANTEGGLAPPELEYQASSGVSSCTGDEGEVKVSASREHSSGEEPRSPKFLSVHDGGRMKRRQSSPALSLCDESEFQNMDLDGKPGSSKLGRSHSFKNSKSDLEAMARDDSYNSIQRKQKSKSSRTAWGRVKDIIHTRKDSLIRKNKRSNSAGDSLPDGSASDGEFFCFRYDYEDIERWEQEVASGSSPRLVRKGSLRAGDSSSPKTPTPVAERECKSPSGSPPPVRKKEALCGTVSAPSSPPQHVDVAALMSSVSDDFNKKIQEWEDKKRKSIYRENSCMDYEERQRAEAAKFSDEFIRKMEEWERIKGLSSRKSRGSGKLSQSPAGANSPEEHQDPPSLAELQKHLSESFSKTVVEWHKIKETRIKDSGSPIPESGPRGIHRSRKQDRSKSRERDRSRSKYERQREKELQKIEKKEQKIEKEKEKLEMMKKKLDDLETMSEAEVRGLTKEFARKLHEWELMKGGRPKESPNEGACVLSLPPSSSFSQRFGVHVRSNSAKEHREKSDQGKSDSLKRDRAQSEYGRRERTHSEGKSSTPVSQVKQMTHPEGSTDSKLNERSQRASSVPLLGNANLVDDSTSIDLNLTSETVHVLEESNRRLLEDMQEKDEDLLMLQDEIQQLTERINMMNKEQSRQIEIYKRDLWASSRIGRHTIENELVSASIRELGDTVDQINRQQNQVFAEKDKLKLQLQTEIAARHAAELKVMDKVQQLQLEGKIEASEGLLRFCQFFRKLQEQLSELRLGVTERNQLVYKLHHQLVTQEVQNRLLQTDLQRTHMQVDFLQDAKTKGTLRRVKTFGGVDFMARGEAQVKCKHRRSGRISRHKRPIMLSRDLLQDLHHALNPSVEPDWQWLNHLEHYNKMLQGCLSMESEESQTENTGADVSVQTVMTLCKVPYNVPQSQAQPQVAPQVTTVGITRTTLTTLTAHSPPPGSQPVTSVSKVVSVKGTQTDTTDETDSKASSRMSINSSYPSSVLSHTSLTQESSSSTVQSSITSSSADSTSSSASLTSVMHLSPTSPKSPPHVPRMPQPQRTEQKSPHVIKVLQSSQALQSAANIVPRGKAPPKPPRRRMVPRIDGNTSQSNISVASSAITRDSVSSSTSRSTTVTDTRTLDNEEMTLTFSVRSVQSHGSPDSEPISQGMPQQSQGSSDTDEVFSDKGQPPYSPIIRSRYPRKLRSPPKMQSENAAWKATPPRRMIRHRKASAERKPDDASKNPADLMSRSQEKEALGAPMPGSQNSRSLPCDLRQLKPPVDSQPRVLSDCYSPPCPYSLAPPIEHYMNNDYLRGRYRFRYQREMHRLPVQDMISRFESAQRFTQSAAAAAPPPDISCDGRKSPIQRPIQTPVHKLKTAQELLSDNEFKTNTTGRRRSSSANRAETLAAENQGRVKISSTSSDKENETAAVQQRISPVTSTNANVTKLFIHSPISENPTKPPLKDLTNGGKVKALGDRSASENRAGKKDSDISGSAVVQLRSDRRSRSASPGTVKARNAVRSDPGVLLSAMEHSNKMDQEGPWDLQTGVVPRTTSPSSMSSSFPPNTPPGSPTSPTVNAERRFHRLFGRKINLSSTSPTSSPNPSHGDQASASPQSSAAANPAASPKTGAISMLCRQALVVNLEQVEVPPDPEDPDGLDSPANRKKGVGKLLDKHWLQKPRKFFKVSKKFKF